MQLQHSASKAEVCDWFERCFGAVDRAGSRLLRSRRGKPTGMAVVAFEDAASANAAMQAGRVHFSRDGSDRPSMELRSEVGYRGWLRIRLYPPRHVDIADSSLALQAIKLAGIQVGLPSC